MTTTTTERLPGVATVPTALWWLCPGCAVHWSGPRVCWCCGTTDGLTRKTPEFQGDGTAQRIDRPHWTRT